MGASPAKPYDRKTKELGVKIQPVGGRSLAGELGPVRKTQL